MNMIDTMPQLYEAQVNGVKGLGYAEIEQGLLQTVCKGVVLFDDEDDLATLLTSQVGDKVIFQGMLYQNGEAQYKSFSAEIMYLALDENVDPGLTFRTLLPLQIF